MSRALVSWAQLAISAELIHGTETAAGSDSGLRTLASSATFTVTETGVGVDVATITTGGTQAWQVGDYGFGFSRYAAAGLVYLFRDAALPATVAVGGSFAKDGTEAGVGQDTALLLLLTQTHTGLDAGTGTDSSSKSPPAVLVAEDITPLISFSWTTTPLDPAPVWVAATPYLRGFSSKRGRNYEYDRMEAGGASYLLNNRDRRFDPDNTGSPYYPDVKPTRRARIQADYRGTVYPVIHGFTDGFPQAFPGTGMDAVVSQSLTDWFYPLNTLRFVGAATTLAADITTADETTVSVDSTVLPLPQVYPFEIQVGDAPDVETMKVTASGGVNVWVVERGANDTVPRTFTAGAPVLAQEVRFAQEQSGTRINHCLDMLGVAIADRDIDAGNSLISASENLAGSSILEHLLLIAECENGRLFVSKAGTITFRERHWQFLQELVPRATFGTGGAIPYLGEGVVLAHDDAKLFNHVKITLADGSVIEAKDQASIDDHMERTLEKNWPLASATEAQDAATWMLARLKRAALRLPEISVVLRDTFTPLVLDAEIAQRYHLVVDPPVAGGTVAATDVIVEGVQHKVVPGRWATTFEFSEPDPVKYWRVEVAGASELDTTTIPAY